MNTDNFSILGLTIDYGPFQFLDVYDPHYICNHSDDQGRYAFSKQPRISLWNLSRFASAISSLIGSETESEMVTKVLVGSLESFSPRVELTYSRLMASKLGFLEVDKFFQKDQLQPWLLLFAEAKLDYTLAMRFLTNSNIELPLSYSEIAELKGISALSDSEWNTHEIARQVSTTWETYRLASTASEARTKLMHDSNPRYILRNNLVQLVIEKAEAGDYSGVNEYLDILRNPFELHSLDARYGRAVPAAMQGIKCSCSS